MITDESTIDQYLEHQSKRFYRIHPSRNLTFHVVRLTDPPVTLMETDSFSKAADRFRLAVHDTSIRCKYAIECVHDMSEEESVRVANGEMDDEDFEKEVA